MSETLYQTRFAELVDRTPWEIELPTQWADYFDERGELPVFADDDRNNQRLRVRICGILWFEHSVGFRRRDRNPVGIYTKDFSRNGVALLTPMELFPEEQVRVALPVFWVQLRVARVRRITSKCFEIGTVLIKHHQAGPELLHGLPETIQRMPSPTSPGSPARDTASDAALDQSSSPATHQRSHASPR